MDINQLEAGVNNYIIYPLETKKDWMIVMLVKSVNYCDTPEYSGLQEVWIRYLDKKEQLRIWYYARVY